MMDQCGKESTKVETIVFKIFIFLNKSDFNENIHIEYKSAEMRRKVIMIKGPKIP